MKVRRHTTKASHPDAHPLENTKYKNICTIEPGRLLKTDQGEKDGFCGEHYSLATNGLCRFREPERAER
jgi:hypothetical protein